VPTVQRWHGLTSSPVFALADKALAGFSVSPCYRQPTWRILNEVKKLIFGTHIFEGGWRLADGKALSSMGGGSSLPQRDKYEGQLRDNDLCERQLILVLRGCTLYEIDPRTGQTIEIFYADSVVAQSFGARGTGFYWRMRDCSSDVPSGPFIICLDAYRDALLVGRQECRIRNQ